MMTVSRGFTVMQDLFANTHYAHAIVWIPIVEPKNSHSVMWQSFFAFSQFVINLKHMRQVTSRLVSSVLLV